MTNIRESEIVEFIINKILPDVIAWVGDAGTDIDRVKGDLRRAIKYNYDGYEIACDLDRKGWSPNAKLVEILDNAFLYRTEAIKQFKEKSDG